MGKRYSNKKHLEWVSELDCAISDHYNRLYINGTAPKEKPICSHEVQAHHLLKPFFSSRGMGLRAGDKDVIPLCFKHHSELHRNGNELKFFEQLVSNSRFGMVTAKQLWEESPYNKEKINAENDTK